MNFGRFFNTSVNFSASLVKRAIELQKDVIREVGRTLAVEFPFLFYESEIPTMTFDSEWFCPEIYDTNVELRNYLLKSFTPVQFITLETSCFLFIQKVHDHSFLTMESLSTGIHNFYNAMKDRALLYGSIDDGFSTKELLDHIEDFVSVHTHAVFCPRSADESLNVLLQDRIRSLHWVTHGFLDTVLNYEFQEIDKLIYEAIFAISKMNTCMKIRDKFQCVSECVDKASEAIFKSTSKPASADDILPVLTYVLLTANPTMLYSNLKFMQYFSLKSRPQQGRKGYNFTTLQAAVQYIQTMSAEDLNMSAEIFDQSIAVNTPQ